MLREPYLRNVLLYPRLLDLETLVYSKSFTTALTRAKAAEILRELIAISAREHLWTAQAIIRWNAWGFFSPPQTAKACTIMIEQR